MEFKDLFKDVTHSVNERIRNPYWFSFLLIFIFSNWESLFYLINIEDFESLECKKEAIQKLEFKVISPLLLAFVGVVVFYFIQYIGLVISVIFQDNLRPNILKVFSSTRAANPDRLNDLRKFNRQLQVEKAELDDELSKARNEKDLYMEEHSGELQSLEKNIHGQYKDMIQSLNEEIEEKKRLVSDIKYEIEQKKESNQQSLKPDLGNIIRELDRSITDILKSTVDRLSWKKMKNSGAVQEELRLIFIKYLHGKNFEDIAYSEVESILSAYIQKSNDLTELTMEERISIVENIMSKVRKVVRSLH
jgi:hypothetical protein